MFEYFWRLFRNCEQKNSKHTEMKGSVLKLSEQKIEAMAVRRVACAISGGVDSAVSAILLKRSGLEVVGVHMVNWDEQDENNSDCPNTKDLADARSVCEQIGIEFHVANFVKDYWNLVFLDLLDNYRRGRTIVPDIGCNRHIKFDLLHKYALENLCVDSVATGHFVRNSRSHFLQPEGVLLKAADPIKDQTYFLAKLTESQLQRSIFPVGGLLKSGVRAIAKEAGLMNVFNKKESMGICFVGKKRNFEDFLLKYIPPLNGCRFVDSESGKVIEDVTHTGVHNFTLGKRVGIRSNDYLSSEGIFVTGLDPETQTVYVCRASHHPVLFATKFVVARPYWIRDDYFRRAIDKRNLLECRIQRTHPVVLCRICPRDNDSGLDEFVVEPKVPIRAAAPGQMCVFYLNDECVGCAGVECVLDTLAGRAF